MIGSRVIQKPCVPVRSKFGSGKLGLTWTHTRRAGLLWAVSRGSTAGKNKLLRTQNGLSALTTGEREHLGKAWEQIYRPAMRTHFAGNLKGDFQLSQRLPNIRSRNGVEHRTAFIAHNISLIPANNAVQAAAPLRISKG